MKILLIDNYDSFVYNIYQIIKRISSAEIVILRNDQASPNNVEKINPDTIIISPGPGDPRLPEDIGFSSDIIREYYPKIPMLGICLGHQIMGLTLGSKIRKAKKIYHGKVSLIQHFEGPLYKDIPKIFKAMRYHSYVIEDPPEDLIIDAISLDDNEIMGIHNRKYPLYGVQFHPESIGTNIGNKILRTFIELSRR
ncbi:MAG: anthranilate synthase component II [Thermoprotei archaeon]